MQVNTRPMSPMLAKTLGMNIQAPEVNTAQAPEQAQGFSKESAEALKVQIITISPFLQELANKKAAQSASEVGTQATAAVGATPASQRVPGYQNTMKSMLVNNEATIMGIIPRTFNAQDIDGNGIILNGEQHGTFVNAVERLDEMVELGINTFHVLPIHPPGKEAAMGTAGSLYSPDEFLAIDPVLFDPDAETKIKKMQETGVAKIKDLSKYDLKTIEGQTKYFNDEAHARGIKLLLDLPSCASTSFAKRYPHMMAKETNGNDKTPQGWQDIRMFEVWSDEKNKVLNPYVLEMHKQYVDMCVDLGFDGIRTDVSRAKPMEFWNIIIPYSQSKDPEFGWLAETYTYEDASPQINMPHDRPYDQLTAGHDAYYGQYHIFNQWTKADQLHDYVKENIVMSNNMDSPKALIGSMMTHDDISCMLYGGAPWTMLTTAVQSTLPQVNPYFVDGQQSGDYYLYPYGGAQSSETMTDTNELTVHRGRIDIFNLSRKPGGNNPEIGEFMKASLKLKNSADMKDVINKGSYIPLETNNPEIIAYARHEKGKTLLTVANRNINSRISGKIEIPGLSANQQLNNLLPNYGEESRMQKENNRLVVDLGPSRAHVFEINTPNIERDSKEVYRQNFPS
ncbi:alpha-amylase [Candidatus Gastranaerophilus sp. (ex Termes propinquus)]|nr:alpha-amylase [Candidatus Gastranaerophilus sp. (ex Termes propinquus)]